MNILYNDKGIYLFQKSDPNKEMYSMQQVSGGKVKEGESSVQAVLQEIAKETGISLKSNLYIIDRALLYKFGAELLGK